MEDEGGNDPDTAVAGIFRRQHGLIARDQAVQLGFSDRQIGYRVRNGRWIRLQPRVYALAASPSTWERKLLACCLASGAVAGFASAGVLWGLDGLRRGRPEVLVRAGASVRIPGAVAHASSIDFMADASRRSGIPVTGVGRTLCDLAAVTSAATLEVAVDSAMRRRLIDWPRLYRHHVDLDRPGRPGRRHLGALLDARYGTAVADSTWNREVAQFLVAVGLPAPEVEHPVPRGDGQQPWRIDLAYPARRLAIELQSIRWHLNRARFESDARRRNTLVLRGWVVLQYTWADWCDRRDEMAAEIGGHLAAQA